MKNIKKALVLVLAFAMVFGMFTINASAASFEDDDAIVNKEAVETMVQLGVINGNPDGTFAPNRVVTRAEMCKMICVALNGGVDPVLDTGATVFSDTQGHWASKYINYCFTKGIISGDSGKGGTFRPDATVTALEAAKMMLVALGYNATAAGFTGADWAQNVAMIANEKGLFAGLGTINVAAGLTRDNAAQLIFNGLNAETVKYENSLGMDNGQLVTIPRVEGTGKTILKEKFGVSILEGVVTASEYATIDDTGALAAAGETEIEVATVDGGTTGAGPYTLKTSTPADLVGMSVKVYVKANSLSGGTYTNVFGAPVLSAKNKVMTFTNTVASVTKLTNELKAAGIKGFTAVSATDGVIVAINNGYEIDDSYYVSGTDMTAADALDYMGAGIKTTFIDNDNDGLVDVIKVMQKHVGTVDVLNALGNNKKGTITVTTARSAYEPIYSASPAVDHRLLGKTFDVVEGEENLAKDDIVLFTVLDGKYYVEKAASVTVEVTKIASDGKVTASGKVYEQSALVNTVNASQTLSAAVTLGEKYKFFLDDNGNVISVKAATTSTTGQYAIVTAVGTADSLNGLSAKIVKEDGTSEVVKLAKVNSQTDPDAMKGQLVTSAAGSETINKNIYSYTINDKGEYELSSNTPDQTATQIRTNDPAIGGKIANSKTVFVVKSGSSYKVYTGIANVPNIDATAGNIWVHAHATTNVAYIVFVVDTSSVGSGVEPVFIISNDYTKRLEGKDTVYEYDAIVNGELTTILAAGPIFTNDGTTITTRGPGYYTANLKLDSKGRYEVDGSPAPVTPDAVSMVGNGVINAGSNLYTYNDDTVVFEIDTAAGTAVESSIGNVFDGSNGTTASKVVIVAKGNSTPNDTVAKYIFVVK